MAAGADRPPPPGFLLIAGYGALLAWPSPARSPACWTSGTPGTRTSPGRATLWGFLSGLALWAVTTVVSTREPTAQVRCHRTPHRLRRRRHGRGLRRRRAPRHCAAPRSPAQKHLRVASGGAPAVTRSAPPRPRESVARCSTATQRDLNPRQCPSPLVQPLPPSYGGGGRG